MTMGGKLTNDTHCILVWKLLGKLWAMVSTRQKSTVRYAECVNTSIVIILGNSSYVILTIFAALWAWA